MTPFYLLGIIAILAGISLTQYNILIGSAVIVMGVVVNILYIMLRPKFPVKAMIFLKRMGANRIMFDNACRVEIDKKSGTYKYQFQKSKDETKAAKYENLYPAGAGEIALFYSPAPGEYYQAKFSDDIIKKKQMIYFTKDGVEQAQEIEIEEAAIKPMPDELLEWHVLKAERAKQRYEKRSMWDKYYPFIVAAVMMVLMSIVISVTFTGMKPIADSWTEAGQSFKEASGQIAAAVDRLAAMESGEQVVDKNVPQQGGNLPAPPDV